MIMTAFMVASMTCILTVDYINGFRFSFVRSRQPPRLPSVLCKVASTKDPYGHVEGGSYDDELKEIEVLGGDPFFLQKDDKNNIATEEEETVSARPAYATNIETQVGPGNPTGEEERFATDGKGSTPKESQNVSPVEGWQWDGTVNQESYFKEGGSYDDELEEIEVLGGDPFFLQKVDKNNDATEEEKTVPERREFATNIVAPMGLGNPTGEEEHFATDGKGPRPKKSHNLSPVEGWEWDGTVDEEAYFD